MFFHSLTDKDPTDVGELEAPDVERAPLLAKAFLEVWDSVVQMAVPVEDENGSSPQER